MSLRARAIALLAAWRDALFRTDLGTLAAAFSFRALLTATPVLLLMIIVLNVILGPSITSTQLHDILRDGLGQEGANLLEEWVQQSARPTTSAWAAIIATGATAFSASGLFQTYRASLRLIFGLPPGAGFRAGLLARLVAMLSAFVLVAIVVVWISVGSVIEALSQTIPISFFWTLLSDTLPFVIAVLLIAASYRFYGRPKIGRTAAFAGAAFAAVALGIARTLLWLYFGFAKTTVLYGSAGAVIVLLIWTNLSAMIVFAGAALASAIAETTRAPENTDSTKPATSA